VIDEERTVTVAAPPRGSARRCRLQRAQQSAMAVVGLVGPPLGAGSRPFVAPFHKGLNETGYVEGQNVTVGYHRSAGY
jgi:hypothetical protein